MRALLSQKPRSREDLGYRWRSETAARFQQPLAQAKPSDEGGGVSPAQGRGGFPPASRTMRAYRVSDNSSPAPLYSSEDTSA